MRVLFWYCDKFAWKPTIKTLENVQNSESEEHEKAVIKVVNKNTGQVLPLKRGKNIPTSLL